MRRAVHLAGRFARSCWPGRERAAARAWVAGVLTPEELDLWRGLGRADRRESIRVARATARRLAPTPHAGTPAWLAAALLHDVGKAEAALGAPGRAVATLAGMVADAGAPARWAARPGIVGRAGRYLGHAERGAERIRAAGGREAAAAWAEAHHHPERWARLDLPGPVVLALARSDGERVPPAVASELAAG